MPPKVKKLASTPMMGAIKSGSVLIVEQSLSRYGMPAPTKKINEHVLILLAIENEYPKLVDLMIKKGCSLTGDPEASHNGSPLHMAIAKINIEILKILLQNKAPLEVTQNGRTPLLCAVHAKQKEIILLLLEYGADWKAVDSEGRTALHLAIETTDIQETKSSTEIIDILKIFLSKGMKVDSKGLKGETPFHVTIKDRKKELVEFLLLHKANINEHGPNGDTVLHVLIGEKIENYAPIDIDGFSIECYKGGIANKEEKNEKFKTDFIEWLISKEADADLRNDNGETPLQLAIRLDQKHTMLILLKYTSESNSSVRDDTLLRMLVRISIISKLDGLRAIKCGEVVEVVKTLIRKGFKVDSINEAGETPISVATRYNGKEILKTLLQCSTNLNMGDKHNKGVLITFLEEIARNDDDSEIDETAEIVKMFLEKGALIDYVNALEDSPISIAACNTQKKILKILLQNKSGINMDYESNRLALQIFLKNSLRNEDSEIEETTEIVKMFLDNGALVDCTDGFNKTPISIAASHNQKKILEVLLQHNSLNMGDEQNRSVLNTFLERNAENKGFEIDETAKIVKIFLKKGALADGVYGYDETPLSIAASNLQKEVLKILLEHNPCLKLNIADKQNQYVLNTLLKKHGKNNDEEVIELVKLLLAKGAPVGSKKIFGIYEDTPILTAAENNQKKILKILLQHDPDLDMSYHQNGYVLQILLENNIKNDNVEIEETAELVKMMLEKGALIDRAHMYDRLPIHIAAKYQDNKILWMLLPQFTNVDMCGESMNTLLHILADTCIESNDNKKDYVEIVQILLSKGAEVDLKNKDNMTPLQLAATHKSKELLETLVEHGADTQISTKNGETILHLLSLSKLNIGKDREQEMVQFFIRYGCNVNAKTKKGTTALHLAAQSGSGNTVKALIEQGADLQYTDIKHLDTPLHLAARHNHESVVKILLKLGADTEARQKDGLTALHMATQHTGHEIVKLLLDYNADIEALDETGKTPLHYACWYENADCIDYLIEHGADINTRDHLTYLPLIYVSESCHSILYRFLHHLVKRHAVDLFMEDPYHNFLSSRVRNNVELDDFFHSCYEETDELARIMVDSRTSLMNVLRRSLKKQPVYQKKIISSGAIHTEEFKIKCPIYRDLVMASYHRCVERFNLMEAAQKSLSCLIGMNLPDFCTETIFSYLDNKSLRELIQSDVKRSKRNVNYINIAISPSKRPTSE